jgi:hypothetical protein
MAFSAQKNGPASAATDPDPGSQSPEGLTNMAEDSIAAPRRQDDAMWDRAFDLLDGMETTLHRVNHLTKIVRMAAESVSDTGKQEAIAAQCDVIQAELRTVLDARTKVASMVLGRVPS